MPAGQRNPDRGSRPTDDVPGTAPDAEQTKHDGDETATEAPVSTVKPEAEDAKPETVMLSIKTPFVDSFHGNIDGKTVEIGPGPTEVDASAADELVKQAKDSGVKLARKGS